MEEVLHANIFFFITGISVIIFSALLCVALFHVVKLLQTVRRIVDRIEEGADVIAEDVQNVREYFSGEGLIKRLIIKLMGRTDRKSKRKSRSRGKDSNEELKVSDI